MSKHVDTVVIGGSAGSFTALRQLLADLPSDLPAAILICQHFSTIGESQAVDLLAAYSNLPVVLAKDSMPIERGKIVFARPDVHMMIGQDHLHLRRGAHENNFRPAIDPLFRSAAVYRGPRAIGVILSGMMDDGAAGARALYRTGGQILVQSPDSADFPDMPTATLAAVPEAEPIALKNMAAEIAALVGTPCRPAEAVPWDIGVELKIAGLEGATMANEDRLGDLSPYNCPHCNGVLWQIEDGPMTRFRCHTGHAYTTKSLGESQERALDESLQVQRIEGPHGTCCADSPDRKQDQWDGESQKARRARHTLRGRHRTATADHQEQNYGIVEEQALMTFEDLIDRFYLFILEHLASDIVGIAQRYQCCKRI